VEKGNGHCCINKYSRNTEELIIENPKLSLGPSHNTKFQEWEKKKKNMQTKGACHAAPIKVAGRSGLSSHR